MLLFSLLEAARFNPGGISVEKKGKEVSALSKCAHDGCGLAVDVLHALNTQLLKYSLFANHN
jgi:hypothetical protein